MRVYLAVAGNVHNDSHDGEESNPKPAEHLS